jgi:hypothetical protein
MKIDTGGEMVKKKIVYLKLLGYLWILLINNVSVTISMYFLVLFYHVTAEELEEFNPLPKFLCIKAVILLAWWQSIIIGILGWIGKLNFCLLFFFF